MKRKFLICLLCVSLGLLPACGTVDDNTVLSLEPEPVIRNDSPENTDSKAADSKPYLEENIKNDIVAVSSDDAAQRENQPSETIAPASPDTYRSLYVETINQNTDNFILFSLIYLNADEIPELVIFNREYDNYSIYTVKSGEVFCMVDSLNTVELTYFERKNIIGAFARWDGGGDEGGYGNYYYQTDIDKTLTEEAQAVLSDSYNAVYNENGEYTGEGVTTYYYMGQETDEGTYQKMQADLGIDPGSKKLCMETAYETEEILLLLQGDAP